MTFLSIARKKVGLTQADVANYLGVTRQAYCNYENGNREPDLNTLLRLSELYKVSADYLLTGENKKAPEGAIRKGDSEYINVEDFMESLNDEEVFFNGEPLDDETAQLLQTAFLLATENAKRKHSEIK